MKTKVENMPKFLDPALYVIAASTSDKLFDNLVIGSSIEPDSHGLAMFALVAILCVYRPDFLDHPSLDKLNRAMRQRLNAMIFEIRGAISLPRPFVPGNPRPRSALALETI